MINNNTKNPSSALYIGLISSRFKSSNIPLKNFLLDLEVKNVITMVLEIIPPMLKNSIEDPIII